jgi:hypothetical protein
MVVTDPIQKGCLVLVRREQVEQADLPALMNQLRDIAGHDRFLLLALIDGASVDVHGPEELKEALRSVAKDAVDEALNDVLRKVKANV